MASNNSSLPMISNLKTRDIYIGSALYVLISLMSIIGNSLVLAAYFKTSKIRNNRTNFLIVSLSCADLISGCLAIPLYMYFMLIKFKGYNKSPEYFVYQFTDVVSITASVWHLAFISLERWVWTHLLYQLIGNTWPLTDNHYDFDLFSLFLNKRIFQSFIPLRNHPRIIRDAAKVWTLGGRADSWPNF